MTVFLKNFLFSIGVEPINTVVIVSAGQTRDSRIHIRIHSPPKLPFHPGCHIALSRVPCALQQVLVVYLFYSQKFASVNPIFLIYAFSLHNHTFVFNLSFWRSVWICRHAFRCSNICSNLLYYAKKDKIKLILYTNSKITVKALSPFLSLYLTILVYPPFLSL